MELEIKLFASLRKFNPELERIEVDDGITILELFDKILLGLLGKFDDLTRQ